MTTFYLLYIDPGTGSLIAQVILAGFVTLIVFFKNSFKRFFSFKKKVNEKENDEKISE
jgi:hypothetical protein